MTDSRETPYWRTSTISANLNMVLNLVVSARVPPCPLDVSVALLEDASSKLADAIWLSRSMLPERVDAPAAKPNQKDGDPCQTCLGEGFVSKHECPDCHGSGRESDEIENANAKTKP